MIVHNLTAEQVQMFINAIGGFPKTVAGGQFTTQQLKTLAESAKGLNDWPKATNDPKVNHAVDCVVCLMNNEEEPEYNEQEYLEEIEASRTTGLDA